MLDLFQRYASAAGAQISYATGAAEAAQVISALASQVGGPIRCTAAVRERYPGLYEAIRQSAVPLEVIKELAAAEPQPSALAAALSGGTGIVLTRAGIAETGSVVLADDALAPRLLSMLADVCVALLPASAVLPGLDEAASLLDELGRAGHRYVSLVTGPSRTADIERELTIGVQGPRMLHIIVLYEEGC
jgi:L-lactate dehydrogenase complex protein LldG